MRVKIIENTFISGTPVWTDDVLDVDEMTFAQLRSAGKAVKLVEAPRATPEAKAIAKETKKKKATKKN